MIYSIIITILFLLVLATFLLLLKKYVELAKFVFTIEDSVPEVIATHETTHKFFEELLKQPWITDSPTMQKEFKQVMEEIRLCMISISKVISTFRVIGKEKYLDDEVDKKIEQLEIELEEIRKKKK